MNTKPTLIVLCGLPGTGKSSRTQQYRNDPNWFVYSTDDYLDAVATLQNQTYNEVFDDYIKEATSSMNVQLQHAIHNNKNVLWDQTNLSKKKRQKIIDQLPLYYKECWYFPLPTHAYKEWKFRLNNRLGKVLNDSILQKMIENFDAPTETEPFDKLVTFDTGLI